MTFTSEDIASFIEGQLAVWPLAKSNYDGLSRVLRRDVSLNGYKMALQCNPARAVSTCARVDGESIARRKCFLCASNRPSCQMALAVLSGWDLLVNPYPILPVHLTIASQSHVPQEKLPDDIVEIAVSLPGMAVFFNGSKAGASAPDHLHLQAVIKDELPLLRKIEILHPASNPGLRIVGGRAEEPPFTVISGVVAQDPEGLKVLSAGLLAGGKDVNGRLCNQESVNTFFWKGDEGMLRFAVVPRRAHRPSCFYAEDSTRRLVSPGAIDMAGIMITPSVTDFHALDEADIMKIYKETALTEMS